MDTPLVEHATMTLAARAGITVAPTQIFPLPGAHALAIRRFDREGRRRIHCLSAGTAIRAATASGSEPELGHPELAWRLRRIGVTEGDQHRTDARELFRRIVFNILVDNTDDHEKNHALLVVHPAAHRRLRLAPAYDVRPTQSGQGDQGRESTLDNAMSQCDAFGLQPAEAAAEVAAVIEVAATRRDHFAQPGFSARAIDLLGEQIDGDALKSQRERFQADRYHMAPTKRRRAGPFRVT